MEPVETFAPLTELDEVAHGFIGRVAGVDVDVPKEDVVERLRPEWLERAEALGFGEESLWTAEQVHGAEVAVVPAGEGIRVMPGVDGLVTAEQGVLLGIMVADCCAVYAVDPTRKVCGLFHAGRKGAELGIVPKGIRIMVERFGSRPGDMVVQLGPCIRPPYYEVDFAATVRGQVLETGVPETGLHDVGICTAANSGRYYSYRREKGKTGRMLAILGFC